MNSKKKIILLGNVASMVLTFREHLIKDLVAEGHQVYCLAQRYSEQDKQIIADWGATAIDSPLNAKGLNPFSDLVAVVKLIKIFRTIAPDIVFSYFVKPVIFGTIAARLAKVPRVIGMIEGLGNSFTVYQQGVSKKALLIKQIQVLLYKLALPRLDSLVLLNNDDKNDLIEQYKIKVKQLNILGGIGLDLEEFSYSPPNLSNISFIFIARLLREKGVFEYLQAVESVKKSHPEVVFYILGGFDTENPFALTEKELEEYLQKDIVIYPGHVNNVPDWIAKSGVFVLPSYREGMPRSTQEAMAIGRPIITTDVAGCRETVVDGVNGFLIPPFSPDKLTEKMLFFINNPEKIEEMGRKSREMAEDKYDVCKVNQRLMRIIFNTN